MSYAARLYTKRQNVIYRAKLKTAKYSLREESQAERTDTLTPRWVCCLKRLLNNLDFHLDCFNST